MSLTEENPETMKAIRCPRCDSPDTKFCYYNNYSTTQPRHFCKNCKRYWTAGGSLRNVPVGGGLRKNKKTKMQANLDSKSKSKSDIDDVVATSSSSADEPLKPGPGSVKSTISPSLAFGQSPLKSDVVGGGGLGLGLGFPYEESPGAGHTSMMKRYPASDENTSYYTPHYPSHGMFSLPHNNGGIRATAPTPFSAPYEHSLGSLPSQPSEAIYGDNGGSSKRLRNNNGEISTAHLGSSEDSVAKSNNSGLFLYGGLSGTTSRLYDTNHHTGHSNNDNIEEPFLNWHQAGFSGATMPSLPPQGLVSDGQDNTQTSKGEEFVTPRGGVNFDDEDEGLGNVVNVRYPYDWEQVSEVLFGGTSDFFQIP